MADLKDTRMRWRGVEIRLKELLKMFHEKGITLGNIVPQHCREPVLEVNSPFLSA